MRLRSAASIHYRLEVSDLQVFEDLANIDKDGSGDVIQLGLNAVGDAVERLTELPFTTPPERPIQHTWYQRAEFLLRGKLRRADGVRFGLQAVEVGGDAGRFTIRSSG